ncbi:MAG: hypothetical protein AB7N24_13305 [Dehalococcoidia bacterium]
MPSRVRTTIEAEPAPAPVFDIVPEIAREASSAGTGLTEDAAQRTPEPGTTPALEAVSRPSETTHTADGGTQLNSPAPGVGVPGGERPEVRSSSAALPGQQDSPSPAIRREIAAEPPAAREPKLAPDGPVPLAADSSPDLPGPPARGESMPPSQQLPATVQRREASAPQGSETGASSAEAQRLTAARPERPVETPGIEAARRTAAAVPSTPTAELSAAPMPLATQAVAEIPVTGERRDTRAEESRPGPVQETPPSEPQDAATAAGDTTSSAPGAASPGVAQTPGDALTQAGSGVRLSPAGRGLSPTARTAPIRRTVAVPLTAEPAFGPTPASTATSGNRETPESPAVEGTRQPVEVGRSTATAAPETSAPLTQPGPRISAAAGHGSPGTSPLPSATTMQRNPAVSLAQGAPRIESAAAPRVQRATAAALPPPPAPAPAVLHSAPSAIQRAEGSSEATGQITGVTNDSSVETVDYRQVAEKVWPYFQRKIRAERERERGLG